MNQINKTYKLSPMQEGILFHSISEPNSGVYVIQWLNTVKESLDLISFKQAWALVIDRHEILRTRFEWEGVDELVQIVEPGIDVPLNFHDWRKIPDEELQVRFEEYLVSDRFRGIKLNETPIFHVSLFQTADSEFRYVWTYHHIIIDGSTCRLILEDLYSIYHALTENRTIHLSKPRPYSDYIDWLSLQDFSQDKEYWQNILKGYSVPARLPESNKVPEKPLRKIYVSESLVLDESLTSKLEKFTRAQNVQMNQLIQAAWSLILYHYCGNQDVVYGIIRACRNSTIEGATSIAGLFINNLPIRVRITDNLSLNDLIKDIQRQNKELRERENTPIVQIKKWSEVSEGLDLFETLYIFARGSYNSYFNAKGGRWSNLDFHEHNQTNYPITFFAFAESKILLKLEYDQRRLEQWMVKKMLSGTRVLLEAMLDNPHSCATDLPYMSETALSELAAWNNTQRDYNLDQTLMDIFEQQVRLTPDSVALVVEDRIFAYRELNERANRLARYLKQVGIGPEIIVGLFMERSLEMVVGIYGILKAGGAYMPLDPDYPAERIEFMIEDTNATVILTQQHLIDQLPQVNAQFICIDSEWNEICRQSDSNFESNVKANNAAYVIFTSGSTGRPKGAVNEHRGIVNRLLWMQEEYRLDATDRVIQKTPYSFDVSVWEFFWPLLNGATLVVARPGGHRDSAYLINTIVKNNITTIHFVPSMLQIFLEDRNVSSCTCLKRVICSGEALPYMLQERFFKLLDAELHNLYGPTEAAVDVTYWACRRDSDMHLVPIGRPVANTQMYILDRQMRLVPIGIPGELYIGGVQVGRGYMNRPELTAEKFLPDPFSERPGARLYKTGDLCRYLPDGNIEYIGRTDFQIKIRGLRIELGEIEYVIGQHPDVREAVVIAYGEGGDKRLAAYIILKDDRELNVDGLRSHLKEKLAEYMVPSSFIRMDGFPLTSSGKVDRRALPAPVAKRQTGIDFVAPQSDIEKTIAAIWKDILKLEKIGVNDNFFDLGGHSLLLLRVMNRLQQLFGRPLTVVDMFQRPTIHALTMFLTGEPQKTPPSDDMQERIARQKEALRRQKKGGPVKRSLS